MGVKMNLRIITTYHAGDPKIRFLTKSILKPYGRATAMPPAWGLFSKLQKRVVTYSIANHFSSLLGKLHFQVKFLFVSKSEIKDYRKLPRNLPEINLK